MPLDKFTVNTRNDNPSPSKICKKFLGAYEPIDLFRKSFRFQNRLCGILFMGERSDPSFGGGWGDVIRHPLIELSKGSGITLLGSRYPTIEVSGLTLLGVRCIRLVYLFGLLIDGQ